MMRTDYVSTLRAPSGLENLYASVVALALNTTRSDLAKQDLITLLIHLVTSDILYLPSYHTHGILVTGVINSGTYSTAILYPVSYYTSL